MSLPEPAGLPNLRHLRLLDAVVRLGSLTAAADRVAMTQPAASQALARLDRVFGARLMQRGPSGLVPTEAGRIVHARTAFALDHIAEAARRVAPLSRLGRRLTGDGLERSATMAQLRALAEFAEAGSFSAAARVMGVTEPAVQRAAREIERLLGAQLFDGSHRALRLTTAGETVAAQAGRALKEIAAAFDELREREGRYDGRLVIGTLPLARTRLVPEAVADLIARHPEARIEIIDGAYPALVRALRNGSCDLIVGALRGADCPPGLAETHLFDDSLAIVARTRHPLAGRPVIPEELAAYPWVLPRRDTPARAVFDRLDAQARIADPARGHVETGSLVALRGVLIASDAVSIISPRQIDHELRQGLLTVLDLALPDTARPIGISMLADWRPTALGAGFLACLHRAAGQGAAG